MTDQELQKLARLIVIEQANNEQWMEAFARANAKLQKPEKRLVSAKKAADILGISVWQLYKIKDDEYGRPNFSYTKGDSQSSPLKFNANTLIEEYERLLAKGKKVITLNPIRAAI